MKKAKITKIIPSEDLVDVWRLFRSSIVEEKWDYPYLGEVHESEMQAYLNRYMLTTPTFFGLIMRIGKKPVAHVFGHVNAHPIGAPKVYFFVHNFWVEKDHRGKEKFGEELFNNMREELKKMGVFHWEATAYDKFSMRILSKKRLGVRKLYTRIGGKV